jgi:hypothetical protein
MVRATATASANPDRLVVVTHGGRLPACSVNGWDCGSRKSAGLRPDRRSATWTRWLTGSRAVALRLL